MVTGPSLPENKDKLVISHYKSVGRRGKQLVEEDVKAGSDTARFLERMEQRRLSTPCHITIDMRGKVPGECEPYEFDKLVHYLDEQCVEIFENEVARYDGKYTVGVFEKVMSAEHTYKAQHEKEQALRLAEQKKQQAQKTSSAPKDALFDKSAKPAVPPSSSKAQSSSAAEPEPEDDEDVLPDIHLIPFGYRSQRKENRLNYSSQVRVFLPNGQDVTGKTSDISLTGIKVSLDIKLEPLEPDCNIEIEFSALEQQNKVQFGHIEYRLIAQEFDDQGRVQLRLARKNQSEHESFNRFLIEFIRSYRSRYKIELEDKLLSLYARSFERIYTSAAPIAINLLDLSDNTASPLYTAIRLGEQGEIKKTFLANIASQLPSMLADAGPGQPLLIEAFMIKGNEEQIIYCANRKDLIKNDHFDKFLNFGTLCFLIARIHVSFHPVNPHDREAALSKLDALNEVSPTRCQDIREKWNKVTHLAYFSLIEEKLNRDSRIRENDERLTAFSNYKVTRPKQQVWELSYRNERGEHRYRYQTKAMIKLGSRTFSGTTVDFSRSGMRIEIDSVSYLPTTLDVNQMVKVSLPELQKLAKKTANLADLSYRITQWHPHQNAISLKRDFNVKDHHGEKFFTRLIKTNQSKLKECLEDLEFTLVAKMIESLVSAYLHGIPLFLHRFPGGRFAIDSAAATENANNLLWRFKDPDGFDFNSLNQEAIFYQMLKGNLNRRGQLSKKVSTRLFAQFSVSEDGHQNMAITMEQDMKDTREIARFILRSRKDKNSRILLAEFLPPPHIKLEEFSDELKEVRHNSTKKALEFEQKVQNLVAVVDIQDITEFYR